MRNPTERSRPLPTDRRGSATRLAALILSGGLLACGGLFACGGSEGPGGDEPGAAAGNAQAAAGSAASSGGTTLPEPGQGGLAIVNPHHSAHAGWRDLGMIPLGEVATHVVELENREGRDLMIQSIRAGCACTIPTVAYRTEAGELVHGDVRDSGSVLLVPDGAAVELTLRVDSRRAPTKNSSKRVNVRIISDSATDPYLTVEAQFTVETPFQVAPEVLDLGRVARNGAAEKAIRILAVRDRVPGAVVTSPEGFQVWLEESFYLGQTGWDLHARALPPIEAGFTEHLIELSTLYADGQEGARFQVPLRITGVQDFEVAPPRLLLRAGPAGQLLAETRVLTNIGGHRFQLSNPRIEGPGAEALVLQLEPSAADDGLQSSSWTLRLQETADLPEGDFSGTVTLTSDDPGMGVDGELVIPYLRLGQS